MKKICYFVAGGTRSKAEIDLLKEKLTEMKGVENIAVSPELDSVVLKLNDLSPNIVR